MRSDAGYSGYCGPEGPMAEASDWIYCRLVDRGTFIFPRRPFWLGQVEFSDKDKDDAACAAALTASMSALTATSRAASGESR